MAPDRYGDGAVAGRNACLPRLTFTACRDASARGSAFLHSLRLQHASTSTITFTTFTAN